MVSYIFDGQTPRYDKRKIHPLMTALQKMMRDEFPELPEEVRAVDYPKGSVRIINLPAIHDWEVVERLTDRADDICRAVTFGSTGGR